jgi:hypothetical protein
MSSDFRLAGVPGVYALDDVDGDPLLVHAYQMGDYGLEDVHGLFRVGHLQSGDGENDVATVLAIDARELGELKILADAYSFDYEEEFIEMCHAMARFAAEHPAQQYFFAANF